MNKSKLTLIELFSGIGAQLRGIENTDLWDCTVVNTAEIDKDAIVSYAAVHCGLTNALIDTYTEYPTREEMAQYLTDRNIGFDYKKNQPYDWFKLTKRKNNDLNKYYLACVLSRNLGDISFIKSLEYADFWTYSFPCQDISVAGNQAGIVKGQTRSGLLYEVERLLETAVANNNQPKYMLLENVKNLVGKQFKTQFDAWIKRLDALGYNTYWKVVNGKDCGIPQNRERVFALSIRKDIDYYKFEFAKPFDNGLRLRDMLQSSVADKYYLSEKIQQRFVLGTEGNNIIGRVSNGIDKPVNQTAIIDDTNCITAREGIRATTVLNNVSNYRIRKLTPTECWRLMGFNDDDVEKSRAVKMPDTALYKQAGNSIITNCITLIVEHLYKAQIDDTYVCFDENFT